MSRAGNEDVRGLRTAWVLTGLLVLLVSVPACSSPSAPTAAVASTTSTTVPVTLEQGASAQVAECQSDAKTLESALEAYMAEQGSFPSVPSPWSAATYVANFTPLTSATGGIGPFLPHAPPTTTYVIEYDASGHVWIAPAGSYATAFNPGQSFDATTDVCLAAVR